MYHIIREYYGMRLPSLKQTQCGFFTPAKSTNNNPTRARVENEESSSLLPNLTTTSDVNAAKKNVRCCAIS